MKKMVTIICPIRNEEKYISKCIDSLLNQTIDTRQLEILIIDGMSDDGTRGIIKSYINKHNNIKLLDNPKKIVTSALNIGIDNASGDIIIRVDGHAQVASDYVEQCVEHLNKIDADCVGGIIESINDTRTGKAIAMAMSSTFGVGNSHFRTSSKEGWVDTVPFGAFKRNVFSKIGKVDEELIGADDDEFNYRLRKNGGKIYLTPKIKSKYFTRSGFRKLWKQYFGYGFWKIRVLQKHFAMMQPRQFVPLTFIFFLFLLILGGLLFIELWYIFLLVLSIYFFIALVISINVTKKREIALVPLVIFAFIILHFSYGFGFLWGIIRFFPRWFQ